MLCVVEELIATSRGAGIIDCFIDSIKRYTSSTALFPMFPGSPNRFSGAGGSRGSSSRNFPRSRKRILLLLFPLLLPPVAAYGDALCDRCPTGALGATVLCLKNLL